MNFIDEPNFDFGHNDAAMTVSHTKLITINSPFLSSSTYTIWQSAYKMPEILEVEEDFFQTAPPEDYNPDTAPPYEGKDPRVQETPWCASCHSRPASGLKCCARCHTVWYCNKDCQVDHYSSHKPM